jgi:acyl carrier protein
MKSQNPVGNDEHSTGAGDLSALTTATESARDAGSIRAWLIARLGEVRGLATDEIDDHEPLTNYGLGSIQAVSMIGELEDWLGRTLPPTLLWDYPTIDELVRHLTEEQSE